VLTIFKQFQTIGLIMRKSKKPSFKPASEFKVVKLSRNGPKAGQSTEAWERGKVKSDKRWDKTREKNFNNLLY